MSTAFLTTSCLLFVLFLTAGSASGTKLGIINGGSSFFEPVGLGWNDTCKVLGIECTYEILLSYPGVTEKDRCVNHLITVASSGIDGLALGIGSNCNPDILRETVRQITETMGIPVVTFDRDIENSTRSAYVGTDNRMMGRSMARLLKQLRPEGGKVVLIAGGQSQLEREEGFVEEITKDNDRDDRAHWFRILDDSITRPQDSAEGFIGEMDLYAEKYSDITAFIILKQTPMRAANWTDHVDLYRHRNIEYIGTDGSDLQLSYLRRKYVSGLIGQLTYDFGSTAVETLLALAEKEKEVGDTVPTNLVSYSLIPLELPSLDVDQNLLEGYVYIGWTCFILICLGSIACLAWTYMNRNGVVVRASQPIFLVMTAMGIIIMGCTLIPLSFDDQGDPTAMTPFRSVGICMSIPWLGFTGFTVIFSALFSKTWRINTLLNRSTTFIRLAISTKDVLGPFSLLLTCNWVVLIAWTVLDPLTYERQFYIGTDFWNRDISSYGTCQSENAVPYLVSLGVLNLIVLVIAGFQAFQARSIETEFSEASYIGLSLFSMCQAYLTGIPIVVIVREIPIAFYLVLTFLIFMLCSCILTLIFVPKISLQKKYAGMSKKQQQELMAAQLKKSVQFSLSQSMHQDSGTPSMAVPAPVAAPAPAPAPDQGARELHIDMKMSDPTSNPAHSSLTDSQSLEARKAVEGDSSQSEKPGSSSADAQSKEALASQSEISENSNPAVVST